MYVVVVDLVLLSILSVHCGLFYVDGQVCAIFEYKWVFRA